MRYLRNSLVTIALAIVLGLGVTACDSVTGDLDKDPNQPLEVEADLVLNGGQVGLLTLLEANFARVASMFSQQMTGSTRQYNRIENGYQLSSGDFDNAWSTGYADAINEFGVVKEQGRRAGASVIVNIAKIQEAHAFGTFAALFGDVPFSEANQGDNNLNPTFDDQVEIYNGIQDSLAAAASALEDYQANPDAPPLNLAFGDTDLDIFYGGDVEKWIRLAYSLKARYHAHQGEYEDALTAANNGLQSPDQNWIGPHGTSFGSDSNVWFNFYVLRDGYLTAEEAYAPQLLDNPVVTGSDSNPEYRGNAKTDEGSRFFSYYYAAPDYQVEFAPAFGFGASFPLFRYAENELIKAEAILKTGGPNSDALDALNNARNANEDYFVDIVGGLCFSVNPDDPADCYQDYEIGDFQSGGMSFETPDGVSETTENALLTEILEEKYLSLISNIEGWNEVRRTENFLDIPLKQDASELPQRWPYAQIEISANENVSESPPNTQETPVNENLDYGPVN